MPRAPFPHSVHVFRVNGMSRWTCGCSARSPSFADDRACRDHGYAHQRAHTQAVAGDTTVMTIEIDVVLAHDGNARIVNSMARCPLCTNKFGDNVSVLRIIDLNAQSTTCLHRTCIEQLFLADKGDGVSDADFEKYRRKLLRRYTAA